MQMAPDDLSSALLEKLSEAQRADATHRSTVLARSLHPFCYLPPSRRPQAVRRNIVTVREYEEQMTEFSSTKELGEIVKSTLEGATPASLKRMTRARKHPGGTLKIVSIQPDQVVDDGVDRKLVTSAPVGKAQKHLKALPSMLLVAKARLECQEHEAARDLLASALDAATHYFGADCSSLVPILMRLAEAHFALGALNEAQGLEERALVVAAAAGDDKQLEVIRNNLATTLYAQREYERARVLLEENVAVLSRTLGPNSPRTLTARHQFGETLTSLGLLPEAQNLFESVLEARLRVLGEDHSETLWTMDALASVCAARGDHERAMDLYKREIEIHAAMGMGEDSGFLTTVNNYAVALQMCGDLDGADEAFERVIEGKRRIHGEAHPDS